MNGRCWKQIRALCRSKKRLRFSLVFLALAILTCYAAPQLGGDPNAIDVSNAFQGISFAHLLGTDELGRDCFLRTLYGGRVSMGIGIVAMLASTGIGVILGMCSGYMGGVLDAIMMGAVEVLASVPWMLMVIAVQMLFKRGLTALLLIIVLLGWGETARLVRNQTRAMRDLEYVEYARLCGVPAVAILLRHVLSACAPTVLVSAGAQAARAILMESTLSFLNLGIQPPGTSWGSLLQGAQKYLMKAPLQAIVPGLLIVATVYSINELANAFSFVADPRNTEESHAEKRNPSR